MYHAHAQELQEHLQLNFPEVRRAYKRTAQEENHIVDLQGMSGGREDLETSASGGIKQKLAVIKM